MLGKNHEDETRAQVWEIKKLTGVIGSGKNTVVLRIGGK